MNGAELLGLPLAAAALALALLVNARWWGFLPYDPPGSARKRHAQPLPMVGVVLGALIVALCAVLGELWIAAGALLATAVGAYDDWRKERGQELPTLTKAPLIALVAAAGVAALYGPSLPWTTWLLAWAFAFVIINALNFLDNTDGVAAAVGGVGLLLATGGDGPLAMVGFVFLGFLPFNWPRPRVLLGDAGALCLGYALATTALDHGVGSGGVHWPALLAPVAVPVLDFVQVVLARVWLGFAPWVGDRRHLTHIAMNGGLPRVLVAPLFAGLCAALFVALR